MAKFKHLARKIRLGKANRQTRWAPFWVIPKVFGIGKRRHPASITRKKRHWRRTKTKA